MVWEEHRMPRLDLVSFVQMTDNAAVTEMKILMEGVTGSVGFLIYARTRFNSVLDMEKTGVTWPKPLWGVLMEAGAGALCNSI